MLVEVVVGGVGVVVSHPLPTCRMTENGGNTDILILWSIYIKALICMYFCMYVCEVLHSATHSHSRTHAYL